ncbi:MAG: phosphatase PAP2 family protein [Deltaproteobacteria bacterium]|jgi:membrane-associated PAP2 superfamily phosphatase|nr:phosphatase PAP2 family protein [Deltaproteobacteria bacterium]
MTRSSLAVLCHNDSRGELGLGPPLPYFLAALICTFLESVRSFDQLAQEPFFRHGQWLLQKAVHAEYRWAAYTAPKVFIGIVGGAFLLLFLASFSDRCRLRLQVWRKPSLLIACSIIFVPLTVAILKTFSGVYSPVDMLPYGGTRPHTGLLEQLWVYGATSGGRSFPAGHASGGFALMALCRLPLRRPWKRRLFVFGILAGWSMGFYQMARGEHFLSHTLTTMFLSLGIMTLLDRCIADSGQLLKFFTKRK